MQGDNFQLDKEPLTNIPIIIPDYENELLVIEIVNNILEEKKLSHQSDITKYIDKIDEIIYRLYGLTCDEIKIIEESVK